MCSILFLELKYATIFDIVYAGCIMFLLNKCHFFSTRDTITFCFAF